MEQDFRKPLFHRVLLTAVFVGIIITLIALFYDVIFIQRTGFPFMEIINVSSLIFSINLLFLAIGPIYYGFMRSFRFGEIIFEVLFVALAIFLLIKVRSVQRTDDLHLNVEFRHLLNGLIIIVATGTCVLLPLLFHNRKFEKAVI